MLFSLFLCILMVLSPRTQGSQQQEPANAIHKSTEQPRPQSDPAVTNNQNQPPKQENTTNAKSEKRPEKPPWWDVVWSTWALVFVGFFGTLAAVWTLVTIRRQTAAIETQVQEMRNTGTQTDKLIRESIAQSQSMEKSITEAARLASAMEVVAKEIAVSSKAAMASVSAINQQMRAYLCVVIGSAIYQDRAKNLKFQTVPSIINAGLTPAHKVSFKARAAILPHPLPKDFTFPLPTEEPSGASVIGPRQNTTISPWVEDFCDDAEVEGIKKGAGPKALYTWGIFTYEDIFGNPQYTKFCQIYTWLEDGKTTWGYYADRHNEAS